jgi:hypothetical protein
VRSSRLASPTTQNPTIITDTLEQAERRTGWIVFGAAVTIGAVAAWHYAALGLTLSHYDARSHLVVARRVIDSLTPGWRQLGAYWLPLPHLLNLLPVQLRWNFQTGFSAVAISIVSLAAGLAAVGRYVVRHTGSIAMALAAPLTILLNPNVLYLQSTPLTEPLLFGFSLMSLLAIDDWVERPFARQAHRAGLLLAGLVLIRFEGWCIAAALVVLAAVAQPRRQSIAVLAGYPVAAAIAFFGLSYASSGVILPTSGFFKPDNPAWGSWWLSLDEVVKHTRDIVGPAVMIAAAIGAAFAVWRTREIGFRSLLPFSLAATVVLPLSAFHSGHPERVRYMVPLVVAGAALGALACRPLPLRLRSLAAVALIAGAVLSRPPFLSSAPMLLEAQWEVPLKDARRAVTAYLQDHYDGTPILASMSSLAHYMQETSSIGLNLANFLHEGNGDLWIDALAAPAQHVRWILIEEQAYGGDSLALRAREDPAFLEGFTRVAAAGGVALYWRSPVSH